MRIWDINPGYLNRQSLLGEHRELHGIVSIIVNKKKGYSHHPETLRWIGHEWALRQRHQLLAAEMSLRGFTDKSPVLIQDNTGVWPEHYLDMPFEQFCILRDKYQQKEQGRIPLPKTAQQFWRQYKYSVLARDMIFYKSVGKEVSMMSPLHEFSDVVNRVTAVLRKPPSIGGLRNALQHMWGYVSDVPSVQKHNIQTWSLGHLLQKIQEYALEHEEPYLLASTALSELQAWIPIS
jgi:uncharacterized protein YbgA (DUF1722 family)